MGEFPGTELDELARRIDAQAREAYQEFLRLLDAGMSPQEAIKEVMAGFNESYYAALAAAFSRVLDERWTARSMRTYPVGEVNLSRRLYAHWRQSGAVVTAIVREHAAGMQQARELALALYQGYGFRDVEPLAVLQGRFRTLQKPLRTLAMEPAVRATILSTARRAAATRLRTAALRSAYVQAFDAALEGASRPKLERLLKAAVHEKARYFANRIAQTELARAHAQAVAEEFMADPTVEVVQWQLSASHPVTDICDVFARVDRFGLGAGCYPKALAPKAPIHPFCRCRLRSRPDLRARDAREREGAERAFLREMGVRDAARAMGGRSRLQRVLNGESVLAAWNRGQAPAYRVPTLGAQRAAIRVASEREIHAFLRGGGSAPMVVAEVPSDIQSRLGTSAVAVYLSRYTVEKQRKHPEITAQHYRRLQELLDDGERIYDKDNHVAVIHIGDEPYVAVLKATRDRREVYLQSFRRTDQKNIKALREKGSGR